MEGAPNANGAGLDEVVSAVEVVAVENIGGGADLSANDRDPGAGPREKGVVVLLVSLVESAVG